MAGLNLFICGAAGCTSSDSEPAELTQLALEGAVLQPAFSPEQKNYSATLNLLNRRPVLSVRAAPRSEIVVEGFALRANGQIEAPLDVASGSGEVVVDVYSESGNQSRYTVSIERSEELWSDAEVMLAPEPSENGFFGDYLRVSESFLYVNASRRGLLYRFQGDVWVLDMLSEELLPFELEWMYEAAIADDALAFVAQPLGGVETIYLFNRVDGAWLLGGEYETGRQGSLRIAGDQLVFITEESLVFFERDGLSWSEVQTLDAPAPDEGFASRPTYFDAPGVAFSADTLVVGASLADTRNDVAPVQGEASGAASSCDGAEAECLLDSGVAYLYERDVDGRWELSARLFPSNPAQGLDFGRAASLAGDWLAIGTSAEGSAAPGISPVGSAYACELDEPVDCVAGSGAVYLFHRTAGDWESAGFFKASALDEYDYFGDTVLMFDDLLLVGAPGHDSAPGEPPEDNSLMDAGGVFAFRRSGEAWREIGVFKLPADLDVEYPFPDQMRYARNTLFVAANEAGLATSTDQRLQAAGKIYRLR